MQFLRILLLILLLLPITSCNKDKILVTSGIVGQWRLAEVKEGSALVAGQPVVFEPVQSNKKIIFSPNGSFSANGDMCFMSNNVVSNEQTGLFCESLFSIEPDGCTSTAPSSGITYELNGDTLIIDYPCIEECQQKYYRI